MIVHPEALAHLAKYLADRVRPPALPLTPLEFAGTLKFRRGRLTFRYDIDSHPPQRIFLEAFGRTTRSEWRYQHLAVVKPTQDGGTMVTQAIPQLYVTTVLGDPVVAGNADMRLASLSWQDKLRPLIVDSGMPKVLPTTGTGSEGNSTPTKVDLAGVPLYYLGAGASNEAGQAMVTGRLLTRDELDSMSPHIAELMTGRQDSYPDNWITVDTSTVKHDEGSPILEILARSTDAHLEYGCPFCGRFTQWLWKHVKMNDANAITARSSIHLVCPNATCGRAITDVERKAMLTYANCRLIMRGQHVDELGQVQGPEPETLVWGFTWTALDSPLIPLAYLAEKYVKAIEAKKQHDHAPMRRFFRDRLCQVYVEEIDAIELTPKALAKQSERSDFDKRQVPRWATYITLGQDVQKDRHYWVAMAFDDTGDNQALIDWGYELVLPLRDGRPDERTPTPVERLHCLDRIAANAALGWQVIGSDERLVPVRLGADVGYNDLDLLPWIKVHPQWVSCKGVGRDQMAKMDRANRAGKSLLHPIMQQRLLGVLDIRQPDTMPVPLVSVNGHAVRQQLHAALMIRADAQGQAAGQCWLPRGLRSNDYLLLHLTSELWTEELEKGKPTGKWYWREVRKGQNHLLDCATYANALGIYHREVMKLNELLTAANPPPAPSAPSAGHSPSHRPRFERRNSRMGRR